MVRVAGAKREHLERVPAEHAFRGREPGLAPGEIDRGPAGLARFDRRERAADGVRDRWRAQAGDEDTAARVDEAREGALIQVVDRALPAELKSKPKRSLIGLLAAMAGLVAAVAGVVMQQRRRAAQAATA